MDVGPGTDKWSQCGSALNLNSFTWPAGGDYSGCQKKFDCLIFIITLPCYSSKHFTNGFMVLTTSFMSCLIQDSVYFVYNGQI